MAEITTIEAMDINNEEQALQVHLDKFIKEITTTTITTNLTAKSLHLVEVHFWHGRSVSNYPDLPPNRLAFTSQSGTRLQGVKFGLHYVDGPDTTARKFVVAFDFSAQKVYADAGPMGPVDWNVVEVKLGMGENKVTYDDHIFGGRTEALMVRANIAKAIFSR